MKPADKVALPEKDTLSPATPQQPPLPADPTAPVDLFEAVWPYLAHALKEPRMESDLAVQFNLCPDQMKAWLETGLDREKVAKLTGPTRYVLAQPPDLLAGETGEDNE
jgi:hypothetical protein